MNNKNKVIQAFSMVIQIGISVLVPVAMCVALGMWLDRIFETSWIMIVLMILGFGAAFRNVVILTRGFYHRDMINEARRREAEARLQAEYDAEKEARRKEREEAFNAWKQSKENEKNRKY